MSRYAMDKVIWEVTRSEDGATVERYLQDPAAYLEGRDLTPEEREALLKNDVGALYKLGAHPFMLQGFGQLASKEDPRTYGQRYLEAIRPHGYPDFST